MGLRGNPLSLRRAHAAWFITLLLVLLPVPGPASGWQPVLRTADGIEIYERESTARGLIEFRGVGVVDAPLPVVATVILDTDRRREWIKGLKESRILRANGEDDLIEYDHIDMPTFFRDRDFVSRVQVSFDPSGKRVVFRYRSEDDPSAPRTGYLRGEVLNMTFVLAASENDAGTMVDAVFLCDPKGWIPNWLVNLFLKDWPKTTFRNLRDEVRKPDITVDRRFAELR